MPATLLVLDIDGTLRPHGEPRVPKENVDALRTVQKAGVKLVIATGRCRAEIPAKMLRGIRPDYWICAAGAQVEDAAGTALYTSHMTAEEMYALVDFCEDYEHPLGFSFSDGGYVYLDYEAFHVQEKAAALEGCLKDGEDQDRHLLDMPFSAFGMLAAEDIAKFQAKYGYLGHCAGRICEQTVKSAKKRRFAVRKGQNCLHCPRRCTIMKGYSLCSGVCLCRGAPYYKEL